MGWILPLSTAACCGLFSVPLLWVRELAPIDLNVTRLGFGAIEVNLMVKMLSGAIFFPVLLGAIFGCGRKRGPLAPPAAVRPVRETAMAAAVYRAALRSTLLAWVVVLLFGGFWLSLPARSGDESGPLAVLLLPYLDREAAVTLGLCLAVLVFWTWKNQVQGFCVDAAGRAGVARVVPLAALVLLLAGVAVFAHWTRTGGFQQAEPPVWLTVALAAARVLKLVCGQAAAAGLRRRIGVSAARLLAAFGGWSLAALLLWGMLEWLVRHGTPSGPLAAAISCAAVFLCGPNCPDALRHPGCLAVIASLFVPFSRLLAGPLALHGNRHR